MLKSAILFSLVSLGLSSVTFAGVNVINAVKFDGSNRFDCTTRSGAKVTVITNDMMDLDSFTYCDRSLSGKWKPKSKVGNRDYIYTPGAGDSDRYNCSTRSGRDVTIFTTDMLDLEGFTYCSSPVAKGTVTEWRPY